MAEHRVRRADDLEPARLQSLVLGGELLARLALLLQSRLLLLAEELTVRLQGHVELQAGPASGLAADLGGDGAAGEAHVRHHVGVGLAHLDGLQLAAQGHGNDLGHLGVDALADLAAAVEDRHGAVGAVHVHDGAAARGVDVAVAVAQGHHGDAALAPAVLAVEGLDLLGAALEGRVVLDALVEHVRVVELHGLLPRRHGRGAVEHVHLPDLLGGAAREAGHVLDDVLRHEHALGVAERSHCGVRRCVRLHAVDLDVEVTAPLVDGGHGLRELEEEEAREVVRATGVAPRVDLDGLDSAVRLVRDLVLDLEGVPAADGDVLRLRIQQDLHSVVHLVRTDGRGARHGHVAAVLGPKPPPARVHLTVTRAPLPCRLSMPATLARQKSGACVES
eukprot:SRR837773.6997.p1 GENE.SRR837773.6997~~SRR837773.6997.p1  ORF type:complete len:391 (-),score=114.61 SRR837773.6997:456-1628(-)